MVGRSGARDHGSCGGRALGCWLRQDATEDESGAARTRTWNQRIMSPVRTRMDLRMTCDSLQTPGLRVQQIPRKHGQSRGEVTLWVTPGR